jgi:hypothetical protein
MSKRWADTFDAAKAAAPLAAAPVPVIDAEKPTLAPAAPPPRPRMIDRRDGEARLEYEFVAGKVRGGKRSDQWGRPRNGASRDGWVGVNLPVATKMRLKRLQARHDLYEWQVLVEAIDLFAKTHGDSE